MKDSVFVCFYLVENILTVFTIYKFFKIFFDNKIENAVTEIIAYSSYFIATSAIYLCFNIPLLTMMANIVFLSLITCLYKSTFFQKISAVGLVYIVSMLIESCVVLLAVYFKWKHIELSSIIVSRIILLVIVQILHTNKYLKSDILIPKIQKISIILFPLGSIIFFQILINSQMKSIELFICLLILLIFDFLVFYIFDKLNSEYISTLHEKMKIQQMEIETQMYLREKNIYQNQLRITDDIHNRIHMLQHDMKGHYFSLKTLLENNDIEKSKQYLERMYDLMNTDEMYVDTGNMTITSILNYYIKQFKNNNIRIDYSLKIPQDTHIEPFDISTILINLLQNALEALNKCQCEKYINIRLAYDRNIFYIMIENTYEGNIESYNGEINSSKGNYFLHGFGMKNIKNSVERYNGEIEYQYTDHMFKAYVMLYDNV